MKKLIMIVMASLFIPVAFAADEVPTAEDLAARPIEVKEQFTVKSGDTKIIPLGRYAFIDRLTLEVKTGLFCKKDNFRISFDGYAHQNVWVKGGLSGYRTKIITADVRSRTLEIHNTTDCKLKVREIQVLPRRWDAGHRGGHGPVYVPVSEAGSQVSLLLETLLYLEAMVGDADRLNYISPSKKVIGRALAVLNAAPETSQASLKAIQDVLVQMKLNHPMIDRLSTVEATFEAAQEIQSVEAALERMVR